MMTGLRRSRLPFLAVGIGSLVYGISVGLVRLGWVLPIAHQDHLEVHGPLMICGFLGTLIGLERAVGLGRRWAYLVPLLTGAGVVAMLASPGSPAAPVAMGLASVVLLAVYAVTMRRQPSLFLVVMAMGAASWLTGNLLWLAGHGMFQFVWWWAGFPVLTIAGERLELTRFLRPTRFGRLSLLVIVASFISGAVLAGASPGSPPRVAGAALAALSAWLVRYDVARRTVRQNGLARFAAVSLLSGYVWLGIGGAVAFLATGTFAGPMYDATLHAIFVGFVFAMILAHAPIIFPAVLGGRSVFRPRFYLPLLLLNVSIALRVAGDLSSVWSDGSWARARGWGAVLTAAAILLFLFNTVRSLRFGDEDVEPTAGQPSPSPLDFLPARWVPLLYLGFAHLSLTAAFAVMAADPAGVAGFFYHPRLAAVVHMITLGWISGSILGSLYLVGPLGFRMALPANARDYAAFACFAVGVSGMVAHLWIRELSGVAWAGGLVTAAFLFVGGRVLHGLWRAPVPALARLPVALAILNLFAAAAMGILLAVNKEHPFLPDSQLRTVFGHAHLAAIGWASMMVMGVGYRLLPMILPAAMPRGPWPYVATVLTQVGVWGIALGFFTGIPWVAPFAVVTAAGLGVFLSQVVWMARHRRPAPPERPRPDPSLGHAIQALSYLAATIAVGLALAVTPSPMAALRWAMAYGVFGLVGFLAQMVTGVAGRIVPLYAWLWGFADRGHQENPPSLHRAPSRTAQMIVLGLWTAGVPALAAGMTWDRLELVRAGAGGLAVATVLGAVNLGVVLVRLWRGGEHAADPARSRSEDVRSTFAPS